MKKMLLAFVLGLSLLLVPSLGYAQAEELPSIEKEDFFDETVNPMYIPCDYWGGNHRLQTGTSKTEYQLYKPHNHPVGGVVLENCQWSYVYSVVDKYCACGHKTTSSTKIGEHHSKA